MDVGIEIRAAKEILPVENDWPDVVLMLALLKGDQFADNAFVIRTGEEAPSVAGRVSRK
jgi:hypothetical protein